MSFDARIQRALAAMIAILGLVAVLAIGALAQQYEEDVCAHADDYGECVAAWIEDSGP